MPPFNASIRYPHGGRSWLHGSERDRRSLWCRHRRHYCGLCPGENMHWQINWQITNTVLKSSGHCSLSVCLRGKVYCQVQCPSPEGCRKWGHLWVYRAYPNTGHQIYFWIQNLTNAFADSHVFHHYWWLSAWIQSWRKARGPPRCL